MPTHSLSIILPAKNEVKGLQKLLPEISQQYPDAEIIVINDGSSDNTATISATAGARVISHPYSMGNGAAIKTGARNANGEILVFMDADGQHRPDDISKLLSKIAEGYDMAVGARQLDTHASVFRRLANIGYNRLASLITGHKIEDLTSGFRAARAQHFKRFLYLLPNGFSYPTTSTMAFFRSGLAVTYVSIRAETREGKSHISPLHDGTKFLLIILKIGSLFSPMRFFLPISLSLFFIGLCYYGYTYFSFNRLTNMSALLFISSLLTFLIGIVSEQVSALHYKEAEESRRKEKQD